MAGFLAHATTALHILALLYIGFGGFLAWRWPKSIVVHIFFAAWGVAVNIFPLHCPLTALEDYFRAVQGLGPLPGGFNEYYLYDTVIPSALLPVLALTAIIVLGVSYVGAYLRWRQQHTLDDVPGGLIRLS